MSELPPFTAGPRRVAVVGTTGSGKTTLARALAGRLGIPHVELDSLHWEPGWTPAATDVFRRRVEEALRGDAWVVDGNYLKVRDLIWMRADTLIWLDLPLPVILKRLTARTARRLVGRHELWNGNRERLIHQFRRDSLFIWALQTYRRWRREYPELLACPEHQHLVKVHLRSARATRAWLETLAASSSRGAGITPQAELPEPAREGEQR